jgi:predicted RNA binding protein YcfA (HicA-like mRNA interferase family)
VPDDFYRDVTRILSEAGWRRDSGGKGSHQKWRHAGSGRTVIVPRTTANEVLGQAGLPKAF